MPLSRFRRDPDTGVLAGVCAGIARTLGVDPTLVRLIFALLALAGGAGILLYLALWAYDERRSPWVVGALGVVAVSLVLRSLGLSDRVVLGIALVAGGPWLWRLAQDRDVERTARIRSEERADLAAHVHDSVLQTLALIQLHADDPRKTAAYARRQERELRSWLYGDRDLGEESLTTLLAA